MKPVRRFYAWASHSHVTSGGCHPNFDVNGGRYVVQKSASDDPFAGLTCPAVRAYKHFMDLNGQVAVVTGASMGIGEAIAKAFADRGAAVVLTSRESERAQAARGRIGHPERTLATGCDVRYREDLDRLMAVTLHNFGRVDIWVNNAGWGFMESVAQANMAEVRKMFDINLFGAIEGMQVAAQVMKEQHSGTIVNISSVAGYIPVPYMALYSGAKAALNAASKGARMELSPHGVHVMTICPGFVSTDFGRNAYKGAQRMRLGVASRRGISAERVARAVLRGYEKKSREVVVPRRYYFLIKLYELVPSLPEYGMARMLRPADQVLSEADMARRK